MPETTPRQDLTDAPEGAAARRIGVVGAGQLARMMLGPAIELGL